MPDQRLRVGTYESPLGPLTIVASQVGLRAVLWPEEPIGRVRLDLSDAAPPGTVVDATRTQLDEYFARTRRAFALPLDPVGSSFQRSVWMALTDIAYGSTSTYAEHALRVGRPGAARAIGSANGRNPLSIVLPCHRVIGADGSLTGFAGGLDAKRFLLDLEQAAR